MKLICKRAYATETGLRIENSEKITYQPFTKTAAADTHFFHLPDEDMRLYFTEEKKKSHQFVVVGGPNEEGTMLCIVEARTTKKALKLLIRDTSLWEEFQDFRIISHEIV